MSNSDFRREAVQALRAAGFEIAKKHGPSKHQKLKHPDGRTAIVGWKTRDRNLLNRILKQNEVQYRL